MTLSTNVRELDQQIFELVSIKSRLSSLKKEGTLSNTDAAELRRVRKLLKEVKQSRSYWSDLLSKGKSRRISSKSFTEASEEWIILMTGIDTQYRRWTSFLNELDLNVQPSSRFRADFEDIPKLFHLELEVGKRLFLCLFLSDIIRRAEFGNTLRIFQEIDISVQSRERKLHGKVDLSIGFSNGSDVFSKPPAQRFHLITVEAKKSRLEKDDFTQCLAEAAALYKVRRDSGEMSCSVCGVLSNAAYWTFMLIDEDGKLWKSDEYSIDLRSYKEVEILLVYRVLHFIIKSCYTSGNVIL
jgi:hypothetical protein